MALIDILHKFVLPQTTLSLPRADIPEYALALPAWADQDPILFRHRYADLLLLKAYKKMGERLLAKALFWLQKYPNAKATGLLLTAIMRYSLTYKEDLLTLAEKCLPAHCIKACEAAWQRAR